jgi:hypothetical protein
MTALTTRNWACDAIVDSTRTHAPIVMAPAVSTVRAPNRSTRWPAIGSIAVMARMRTVAPAANSDRLQPSSAVIVFIRIESTTDDAACAVTARTPTPSAAHARQDSPRGDRTGVA